jgi:hypothetical protein
MSLRDTDSACSRLASPTCTRHRREHPVLVARQLGQHALGVGRVVGLAIDGRPRATVVSEHRMGAIGQPTARAPGHGGVELEAGDALHVGRPGASPGSTASMASASSATSPSALGSSICAHAQLFQQLAAARALGGEVDEVRHEGILKKIASSAYPSSASSYQ